MATTVEGIGLVAVSGFVGVKHIKLEGSILSIL
jgi:hypothetical protein